MNDDEINEATWEMLSIMAMGLMFYILVGGMS